MSRIDELITQIRIDRFCFQKEIDVQALNELIFFNLNGFQQVHLVISINRKLPSTFRRRKRDVLICIYITLQAHL